MAIAANGIVVNGTSGLTAANAPNSMLPPGLIPQNGVGGGRSQLQVPFDFSSLSISSQGMSVIEQIAHEVMQGRHMTIQLLARDTELLAPLQRHELARQRAKSVGDALSVRGVDPGRISVSWLPDPSDPAITRDGPGYQVVGTVVVGR